MKSYTSVIKEKLNKNNQLCYSKGRFTKLVFVDVLLTPTSIVMIWRKKYIWSSRRILTKFRQKILELGLENKNTSDLDNGRKGKLYNTNFMHSPFIIHASSHEIFSFVLAQCKRVSMVRDTVHALKWVFFLIVDKC